MTYPDSIDEFRRVTADPKSLLKIGDQNNMADTVEGIENSLGTNPEGSYDTVKDRLDAISVPVVDEQNLNVYEGNVGTSPMLLDLSGYVGARRALIYFELYPLTASARQYAIYENGIAENIVLGSYATNVVYANGQSLCGIFTQCSSGGKVRVVCSVDATPIRLFLGWFLAE